MASESMRLRTITVHPIKSCPGVDREVAELDARGLRHDRRFMLVDEGGRFVTLREEPRLALVRVAIVPGGYEVRLPEGATTVFGEGDEGGPRIRVKVWDHETEAERVDPASEAFTRAFGRPLTLVRQCTDRVRPVTGHGGREGEQVSFADAYPLLMVSVESLDDLSRRVGTVMEPARFRPNLLVDGVAPYAEDLIARMRIGDVWFRGTKGCSRCVATTVDPVTASTGREPLRTLAGYRREAGQVWLGMNVVHEGTGILRSGDRVEITATHEHAPRA